MLHDHLVVGPTAIRTQFGAIFVSLELSRSNWILTSLSPGNGEKMSQFSLRAGDVGGLLARFAELKRKARERTGSDHPIVSIHEAGLDGFWVHRVLQQEGVESHVVDAASIATPRRRRRAKTDKLDGEALLRALLAFQRGEPRVCSMVVAPSPEQEDRRRLCRERQALIAERITHVNRIKGLLFAQGIADYAPLRRDRRKRLADMRTGDGRPLPRHLRRQVDRELDRLELLLDQIGQVEAEQQALLAADRQPATGMAGAPPNGLGDVAGREGDRRTVCRHSVVGRTEPGVRQSPAGRSLCGACGDALAQRRDRPRAGPVEGRQSATARHDGATGWLWLRHQPQSALARWFRARGERPQGLDRGTGPQAAGGVVEVRQARRHDRGGGDEARSLTRFSPT
jgi:transposase